MQGNWQVMEEQLVKLVRWKRRWLVWSQEHMSYLSDKKEIEGPT